MTDLKFIGVNVSTGQTEQKQADPSSDALLMDRFKPSGGAAGPFVIAPLTQVTANAELFVIEDGNGNQVLRFTANAGVVAGTITGDLTVSQDLTATNNVLFGSGTADTATFARAWSDNATDFDYASAITLDPSTLPAFGNNGSVDILIGTGTADPDVTGATALQGSLLLVTDGTAWMKTGAGDTAWTQLATSVLSTLDGVLTGGTPDNDVNIPLADPIIYRDNAAAGFDVQTIDVTAAGTNDALAISMGAGGTGGAAIDIDILGAAQGVTIDASTSTNPLMTLTKSGGAGVGMVIDVSAIAAGRGVTMVHGASGEGISMSDGTSTSFYSATSLNPLAAYEVRPTVLATGNGFDLTLSGGTSGSGLSDNGGDLVLIGGNGNTLGVDGDVLIGNLTTTNDVTIAPAGAVAAVAGTAAAGSGSAGSTASFSAGVGALAAGGTGAGPGGTCLIASGDGGASDGTDAASDGALCLVSAGAGGAGSGIVAPGNAGSLTLIAGLAGVAGATAQGAEGGDVSVRATDGGDAAGTGGGGGGGAVNINSGVAGLAAGGSAGGPGGAIDLEAAAGSAGTPDGVGGRIKLETGAAGGATAAPGKIELSTPKQDGDTTPAFKYAEAATLVPTGAGTLTSGMAIYAVSDDPNSEVTAVAGSIAMDDGGKAWVNTDGTNTGWDELLTIASGSPSLDDAITSAGVIDNDVIIALADPLIFNDGGVAAFDLLTLNRTGVGAGDALVINMGPGGEVTTGAGINILDGTGADGSPLEITHDSGNTSAAIQINSGQFHAAAGIRIEQTVPSPVNTTYGLLGIFYGGFGGFAEFNIIGAAPTTIGAAGRDVRVEVADGADGDGGTPAGPGGGIRLWAGSAGADFGPGGGAGGGVSIRAGAGTGVFADGTIDIGLVGTSQTNIGTFGAGAVVNHNAVPGAAGNAVVLLNTSIAGANSGSYAIGVNTTTLPNLPGIANPDLQATLEEIDSLILSGGTLQSNYVAGNTIDVTAANGPVDISNTAADPTNLLTLVMGATTTGHAIDITMTTGATGNALQIDDGTQVTNFDAAGITMDAPSNDLSFVVVPAQSTGTTTAGMAIDVDAGVGSVASGANAGGTGGAATFEGGVGGAAAAGAGVGGNGGFASLSAGTGGAGSATGAGGGGGSLLIASGDGGSDAGSNGGSGGTANLQGGQGANSAGTGTSGSGGTISVTGGVGGAGSGPVGGSAGGQASLRGGDGGNGDAADTGAGGAVEVAGGAAGTGGNGASGGGVVIEAGIKSGGASDGDITIGVTTANNIDIGHANAKIGFYGATAVVQSAAYTRNATIVEDRTLLASASATTVNNNNVLASLISELQALGLIG